MRSTTTLVCITQALLLAVSCSSSPEVLIEAADYSPIGEALKFLGLALLACVIVHSLVKVFKDEEE